MALPLMALSLIALATPHGAEALPRSGDPRTDDYLACNLGIGGGFSVREVIAAAERAVGHAIPFTMGIRRAGDPPILVASAARAGEVLGWRPRYTSLDDMVGSAWAWRQQHPGGYPD